MQQFLNYISEAYSHIGSTYGVNPIIFAVIYVASIPIFFLSLFKVVNILISKGKQKTEDAPKELMENKRLFTWAIVLLFDYLSPYLYVLIYGKNFPVWAYFILIVIILLSTYSLVRKVKKKIRSNDDNL